MGSVRSRYRRSGRVSAMTGGRAAQLVGSCVVLGVRRRAAAALRARLGRLLDVRDRPVALAAAGTSRSRTRSSASSWSALAWWRGTRPGLGTVAQTVVVGATVSAGLAVTAEPASLLVRALLLGLALPVLALGVAGYLNTDSGAGPRRPRRWPSTRRCRSRGATTCCRARAPSSAGCGAPTSDPGRCSSCSSSGRRWRRCGPGSRAGRRGRRASRGAAACGPRRR